MRLAREADDSGDHILAGIYRVEAGNDRSNHVKIHKPSLGPYTGENQKACVDCGKALGAESMSECLP